MFAADFLTDVADFNQAETSGFIRLKTYYWHNGGLPDDDDKVRRVARMTKAQWENSRDRLAEMFTSGWRDEYLDSERDKAEDTSAMKAEAGRKGGLSKTRTICTNT